MRVCQFRHARKFLSTGGITTTHILQLLRPNSLGLLEYSWFNFGGHRLAPTIVTL